MSIPRSSDLTNQSRGTLQGRVRRDRCRDPARAGDLHAVDSRQPAVRGVDRRGCLGARLGDGPRGASGVQDRRRAGRWPLDDPRAVRGGRVAACRGHRRPAAGCGRHAVPHAGALPPRRHPAVPPPSHVLAPAAPHRPAALERELRRRGRLGADRAAADGCRHDRDDGDRGGSDASHRRSARGGGAARLPAGHRHQHRLPTAAVAPDDTRTGAARRAERGGPRVVRRCARGQVARPGERGDGPVRDQGAAAP